MHQGSNCPDGYPLTLPLCNKTGAWHSQDLVKKLALPDQADDDGDDDGGAPQQHPLVVRLAVLAEVAGSAPNVFARFAEIVLAFVVDDLLPFVGATTSVRSREHGGR